MDTTVTQSISDALTLIAQTSGYEAEAEELTTLWQQGRIRYEPELPDRGQTALGGTIRLGPEAVESGMVSLAATLIHENYHRHQNPLLKTVSFWSGVATHSDTMQRYEAPAYEAATRFLLVVAATQPEHALVARQEADATQAAFTHFYAREA